MRPLNRPMFRMGGPIKEGIMQGMQDRPGYFLGGIIPLAGAALRALPVIGRGIMMRGAPRAPGAKGFFRNLFPTGRFRTVAGKQSDPSAAFIKGDFTAASGAGAPKTLGLGEALKNPLLIGKAIRENPFTAAGLLPVVGTGTELIGRGIAGAAKMSPDALRAYANAVIPFADPFTKKEEVPTKDDGTGLKRADPKDKNVGTVTGTTAPGQAGGTTVKSDAEKQQINEARIQETKDKYYKLMGIDKMNKDAVYDSLIDASKIVSEEGADLKGAIRSGNLQNRIIQAISQNLDKSADLKKQIDAAVLKGEIEKDINKTKLTSFQEQIKFIKENPDDPLAKKLSGATSVADNLAALADKPITSDIVQRLVESKGQAVKGQVKDDKYQKWEKNNEGKDEIDYLQDVYKGQTLDAGIYIINKKAIRIDEGGNAFPVDLDSIIG